MTTEGIKLEIIKRLSQKGLSILYEQAVPPTSTEETYIISESTFSKITSILNGIEKVAGNMGYNRKPQALEKVKSLLNEMLESNSNIEWLFDSPRAARMNIYEGINYAVRSKKKENEKYTELLSKYKLKIIEPNILKAELRIVDEVIPNGRIDSGTTND